MRLASPYANLRKLLLLCLVGCLSNSSCKTFVLSRLKESERTLSGEPNLPSFVASLLPGQGVPEEYLNPEAARDGRLWTFIRTQKEVKLQEHLRMYKDEFLAFQRNAVAYNGTPAMIFQLLPLVMPDLFSDHAFEYETGFYKLNSSDLLPFGMAFVPTQESHSTREPYPLLTVNLTCAACHTGRVIDNDGQVRSLVGAPSTVADINGFRGLMVTAVRDPRFNFGSFAAALQSKAEGTIFGHELLAKEKIERALFLGHVGQNPLGPSILKNLQASLLKKVNFTKLAVSDFSYRGDNRLIEHSPGHIDFPAAVASATAPREQIFAQPDQLLPLYFARAPGIGDIMSVWRQVDRPNSQWDGRLKSKLMRNIGAALGIAADPNAVNFANAESATSFLEELPAPSYPFPVDLLLAKQGQVLYQQICARCHAHQARIPIYVVGTDPGRATGLTQNTKSLLIKALRASCQNPLNPACQVADDELVIPEDGAPGYVAPALTGIWARAPYLHNGSIPSIYHLLVPSERPNIFATHTLQYDEYKLGFIPDLRNSNNSIEESAINKLSKQDKDFSPRYYDTQIPGYSNRGHEDIETFFGGIDFKQESRKRQALLEFLKTL